MERGPDSPIPAQLGTRNRPRRRPAQPPTGHVFRVDRVRGPAWYAKYRLPDGRQVQRKLGPAWTERGRPPAGYYTKRTAEAWLRDVLDEARRGTLPGMVRTGATFADAAAEWLRYVEQERGRKASTIRDYNSVVNVHLLPAFGQESLEKIDADMIESWLAERLREGELSRRSLQKIVVLLNGIFKRARKVWKLTHDPMVDVERLTVPKRTDIEFYSPEEVHALVRAAANRQDAALFLTGALTGLRMGALLALRWRDIDFPAQTLRVTASYTNGKLGTPKSGLGRAVPLVDEVAQALARLGTRKRWAGPDDLVFVGQRGEYLDDSALRRRFKRARDAAGLRPLRFHALRHAAGSLVAREAGAHFVQAFLGHSRLSTTERYLHAKSRPQDVDTLNRAFAGSIAPVAEES